MLRMMTFMHCQFQTVGVVVEAWFNEQNVWLWTLLLIPSPTGSHPARRDSSVCTCIHICLVWSVFLTAFIVPHHCHMDVEWELLSVKLYPHMGSKPDCKIFNLQRYSFKLFLFCTYILHLSTFSQTLKCTYFAGIDADNESPSSKENGQIVQSSIPQQQQQEINFSHRSWIKTCHFTTTKVIYLQAAAKKANWFH